MLAVLSYLKRRLGERSTWAAIGLGIPAAAVLSSAACACAIFARCPTTSDCSAATLPRACATPVCACVTFACCALMPARSAAVLPCACATPARA